VNLRAQHITSCLLRTALLFTVVLYGCHVSKFIPEDEKLYTGATVTIEHRGQMKKAGRMKSELEEALRPRPNSKTLGGRFRLWAHYKGSRERSGFLTRFLNRKFGETPVYLSDVDISQTEQFITNRLENRGYYYCSVNGTVTEKKNKASLTYEVTSSAPYTLKNYQYLRDSAVVDGLISNQVSKSSFVEGDLLNLDVLKAERARISDELKTKGYYNFTEDLLLFRVDTNQYEQRRFDLFLDLKYNLDPALLKPYVINHIYVHTDYSLEDATSDSQDTTLIDGFYFIDKDDTYDARYLPPYLTLTTNTLFSTERQLQTNRRLSSVGMFKYVTTRFTEADTARIGPGRLDANIYLSRFNRHSVSAEVQATTKSNNFAGPGLILSYQNINLFGGGEVWKSSLTLGYETQVQGGSTDDLNSSEISFQHEIVVPRVIAPFKVDASGGYSVPKTKFAIGYSILNRSQYYRLTSLKATYGFFWQTNRYVRHDLTPISLNFTNTSNITADFEEILEANPFLRQSFENQFIPGLIYKWQFNEGPKEDKRNKIFVEFTLDVAGNIVNSIGQLFGGSESETMFGLTYAKYTRGDIDFRYYIKTGRSGALVWRGYAGLGVPYGRSVSLPYIKQYFSGGPGSIRAFRVRSLGPGSYQPPPESDNAFFDQAGDIKLETNLEYRFSFYKYLKGALFVDAGNVWLFNENESVPGGQWSNQWLSEIALGTGAGLRLDIDFLVLRLDLGIPLGKPFLAPSERWIDRFDIGRRSWRRENMIWNLAIGYPF